MSRVLPVADAADTAMCLTAFLGARPTQRSARASTRSRAGWWSTPAARSAPRPAPSPTVAPHNAGPVRGWVRWLLERGYRVFAKPRLAGHADDDMLAHVEARIGDGGIAEVVVVSDDARAFLEPLEAAATARARATVLGLSRCAATLADSVRIASLDPEDIPGPFDPALPGRVGLDALPPEGRWFAPTGVLGGAPARPDGPRPGAGAST